MAPRLVSAYRGLTAVAPWLLTRATRRAHARQGAESARLPERLGTPSLPRPRGKLIWLHAASVGEVQSLVALAPRLAETAQLLLTTATETGRARAAAMLPPETLHQFAPVDSRAAVQGFLDHWQPDLALFAESDLWPRMSAALGHRGIPCALLNARASRSRKRAPAASRHVLEPLRLITCQSEAVLEELAALGLPRARLAAPGDLKADLPPLPVSEAALSAFTRAAQSRPVWAAVSTHPADEPHVVTAHRALLAERPDALLLWLPRHPARAGAIRRALDAAGLSLAQHSRGETADAQTQVLLQDTLGDAGAAFRAAPVVFLGGGFGKEGGHNPYEPAKAGAFVLSGPETANFAAAYDRLEADGFATRLADGSDLAPALAKWLDEPHREGWRQTTGGQDAATRTVDLLTPLMGDATQGTTDRFAHARPEQAS